MKCLIQDYFNSLYTNETNHMALVEEDSIR